MVKNVLVTSAVVLLVVALLTAAINGMNTAPEGEAIVFIIVKDGEMIAWDPSGDQEIVTGPEDIVQFYNQHQ